MDLNGDVVHDHKDKAVEMWGVFSESSASISFWVATKELVTRHGD